MRLWGNSEWLTVVGVVHEAASWKQERGGQNEIYVPLAQQPAEARYELVAVLRTSGSPQRLVPLVAERLRHSIACTPSSTM